VARFGIRLATGLAAVALVTSNADPDAVLYSARPSARSPAGNSPSSLKGDGGRGPIRTSRPLAARAVVVVLRLRRSSRSSAITGPSCCSPGVARSDCSPPRSSPHPCCPVSSAPTVFGDGHPAFAVARPSLLARAPRLPACTPPRLARALRDGVSSTRSASKTGSSAGPSRGRKLVLLFVLVRPPSRPRRQSRPFPSPDSVRVRRIDLHVGGIIRGLSSGSVSSVWVGWAWGDPVPSPRWSRRPSPSRRRRPRPHRYRSRRGFPLPPRDRVETGIRPRQALFSEIDRGSPTRRVVDPRFRRDLAVGLDLGFPSRIDAFGGGAGFVRGLLSSVPPSMSDMPVSISDFAARAAVAEPEADEPGADDGERNRPPSLRGHRSDRSRQRESTADQRERTASRVGRHRGGIADRGPSSSRSRRRRCRRTSIKSSVAASFSWFVVIGKPPSDSAGEPRPSHRLAGKPPLGRLASRRITSDPLTIATVSDR